MRHRATRALIAAAFVSCTPRANPHEQPALDAGAALDASADAGSERDAAIEGDAAIQGDAGQGLYAHCSPAAALPAWATERGPGILSASCGAATVTVEDRGDGTLHLYYGTVGPRWWNVVSPGSPSESQLTGTSAGAELCTERARAVLTEDCCARVYAASGASLIDDDQVTASSIVRHTPASEKFFGFGEKTGPLDKRGRRMTFWNTDAYDPAHGGFPPDADPLYLSIPFFIGLRDGEAYGVFHDDPHRLELDIAARDPLRYRVETFGGALDQWIFVGPEISEVVRRYTALTGRPSLPPIWALGYHQSRWGYAPRSRVEMIAAEFRARNLPADAIWLDIQHMDGFRTFTFDPVSFPDPQGLATTLESSNFHLTVIADPGIKVDPNYSVYQTGISGDHFLKSSIGEPWVGTVWPGDSCFPDFTRPETRAWWGDQVAQLSTLGVDGVWLDVNEPTNFPESGGGNSVPNELAVDAEGSASTMAEAHNVYALEETRATFDGLARASPDRRPFVLSRAGYSGIQKYAAVWTGDAPSTWWSLQGSLPMLLNLGLSGLSFSGTDVGGYSGGATPELYARWMALGSISPFFRGHVTNGVNDQEPWAFGPEVEIISRERMLERYRLMPYLYSLFHQTSESGAPMLRPLIYDFQNDAALAELGDQAMFGPFLLYAPVLEEGASERAIILPAGRWYEARSDAIWDGPATIRTSVTLAALPMFVREGAIIPRGPDRYYLADGTADELTLDLYPASERSTFELYEDRGDGDTGSAITRYQLEPTATGIKLTAERTNDRFSPPARTLRARVHRADLGMNEARLDGAPITATLDANARIVELEFTDRDRYTLELDYDRTITELRPNVEVTFEVTIPPETPAADIIHIAISSSGWNHLPLVRESETRASGTITVPRGEWFFYKYTRGAWETVEKWPGCLEATNRYAFGAATVLSDDVFTWRDLCE